VHHRCITATAFRDTWRNRHRSTSRMVEPKLAT
jgi:hypothetical protein